MSRFVHAFNFAGVLILAGVVAVQWQGNRRTNLEVNRVQKIRLEQEQRIEDQEKIIAGYTADLETFRGQIQQLSTSIKDSEAKSRELEQKLAQAESQREQLKESVTRWAEAVELRDGELLKARGQIEKLTSERNATVERYNDLAEKYNSTVRELNKQTEAFNGLVERYNKLAKEQSN